VKDSLGLPAPSDVADEKCDDAFINDIQTAEGKKEATYKEQEEMTEKDDQLDGAGKASDTADEVEEKDTIGQISETKEAAENEEKETICQIAETQEVAEKEEKEIIGQISETQETGEKKEKETICQIPETEDMTSENKDALINVRNTADEKQETTEETGEEVKEKNDDKDTDSLRDIRNLAETNKAETVSKTKSTIQEEEKSSNDIVQSPTTQECGDGMTSLYTSIPVMKSDQQNGQERSETNNEYLNSPSSDTTDKPKLVWADEVEKEKSSRGEAYETNLEKAEKVVEEIVIKAEKMMDQVQEKLNKKDTTKSSSESLTEFSKISQES
jgi:hypothetical protein